MSGDSDRESDEMVAASIRRRGDFARSSRRFPNPPPPPRPRKPLAGLDCILIGGTGPDADACAANVRGAGARVFRAGTFAQACALLWIEDAPSSRVCFLEIGGAAAGAGAVPVAAVPPGIEISTVAIAPGIPADSREAGARGGAKPGFSSDSLGQAVALAFGRADPGGGR